MIRTQPLLALVLASGLAAVPVEYPLANASFESPALNINNTWYGGVSGWQYQGSLGTTFSAPYVPGYPAPNGSQFLYGASEDWQLFQQTGTIQANTRYWMKVSLYPLATGTNRADIVIEETDSYAATFAAAYHQPTWEPARKDFQLPAGQWTTVTIGFNSAEWASMVGHNFRIRVHGYNLAVDNARLIVDNEIHSFYISNSGSDSNSGTSETAPWKTFNNLAEWLPLQPGERVLLKRGDTFTQELYLKGKGTAAAPIELGAYGTGPKPIISRSDLSNDICVKWESPSYARISQLDCRNSKLGIYLRYHYQLDPYNPSQPLEIPNNQDVRIDSCNFKDMTDGTLDPSAHDYEFAYSDAIFLGGHDWITNASTNTYYTFLDGLSITNCVAENTAHGFGTGWYYPVKYRSRLKNLVMEDNLATNCLNGWASLMNVDGGWMKRCHSIRGGGKETWAGTTMGMMQSSQNFLIQDCEFSYCDRVQAGDGSGMDFEGDTIDVTFDRNIIHNNDACGLLILSTDGPNQNLVISNNVLYGNARNPWNSNINSEIQGSDTGHTGCQIINNGIYRGSSSINYRSSGTWSGFTISGNREGTYVETNNSWNFNEDGNLEGWSGFNDWTSSSVAVGKLQGTSGADPFVHSPPVFINPYLTPYVWIRMRQTAGGFAQLFYITENDTAWHETKSTFFPIIADGQYHDYFIDLLQAGVTGVITQIRLDPTGDAGSTMAIDFVRLTDSTDPYQAAPAPLPPVPIEALFTSISSEDGQVTESGQNTGAGGTIDSSGNIFKIGDDASNRAYRSVLSFDTSSLPDNATVTEATLGITRIGDISGTIPIGVPAKIFGDIVVDMVTGSFNLNSTLESADWQAAPVKSAASKFAYPAYSDGMTINSRLETSDLGVLNRLGKTQFRIRYEIDDDNDSTADYSTYATSNHGTASYRPKLTVKYLTNRPPAFLASPYVASATVGGAFSAQLAASDPDAGNTLTFSKFAGPAWLTVSPSGALVGTPGPGVTGSNSFTARVTDAAGASDYATLEINVAPGVAVINLGNLSHVYNGSPKSATASTAPADLDVALTYDGSPLAPSAVGSYAVAATVTSPGYVGSASDTLVISAKPDANGNGMLDAWEIEKFGNANPGANLPGDDADGDGVTNLLEYAFNTGPKQAAPSPAAADFAQIGGDRYLRLRVPKNPAATNLSYFIEVSGDLQEGSWSSLQTTIEENDSTHLTARDNVEVSTASRRFIRLRVLVNP
jgi:hypothetical protein